MVPLLPHLRRIVGVVCIVLAVASTVRVYAQTAIAFVQVNSAVPQSPQSVVTTPYTAVQTAGNLNVVVVGWNDSTAQVQSVVDSKGNAYVAAVGPTVRSGFGSQIIYYAKNIVAATAGANTVTVTFNVPANYVDLRIAEYRGLDPVSPFDVAVAGQGSSTSSNSGAATTTSANALLVGANLVLTRTTGAGTSYTKRVITSPDSDILEDRVVAAIGSYSATAPLSPSGAWIMQMVAFRGAPGGPVDTQAPTTPASLTATAASGTQINLSWPASSDNVAVTQYLIERCQGAGCATFAQIGTSTGTTFSNTGLTPATSYGYRVRATDAAGNLSGYSPTAPAATPDTVAPTTPGNVAATVVSDSRVDLSWTASTDNVAVTQYLIERCQGTGCTAFAQIATAAGSPFANTGLTGSTVYRYRLRATDAAGNASGYSAIVTATTLAAPDTQAPTAPATLTATVVSATQVDLSWPAATDNVGVTQYLIERCQGAGCATFAQIATTAALTFSNTGLTGATSYSYRVRATDAASNLGAYSPEASATMPDAQPPTAPATLTATAVSANQIDLNWQAATDNAGVTQYLIERCQGAACGTFAQIATTAALTFSNIGLTGGTSYSFRVRATDAAGNLGAYSPVASATTPDTQAPTAPATLTAMAVSESRIDLSWPAATDNVGVTQYLIERCQSAGCATFAQIATTATLTFSNTGLTSGTSYTYQVRATDAAGNLGAYSPVATATTATPDTQAPTAPVTLTATAASASQIDLSWPAATDDVGVTQYLIERCQDAGCTTFAQIATATTLTFSNTGLTNATSYTYRVRATDAAGNLGAYSPVASATTPDTQAPMAPATLTATPVSASQIDLSWPAATDNVGVAQYLIERCQGAGCTTFAQIATTMTLTFSNTGLTNGTSYRYRVRATDAANNLGPYSPLASATTADTQPPTAPATVAATAVSATQVDLSWPAATDNVGVTQYLIERCQGAGCATFAQIATTPALIFSNTGLTPATGYSYRVRATDAAGNLGVYSPVASTTTPAEAAIAFVQTSNAVPQSTPSTVAVTYSQPQAAGNLNVVVVGWNSSSGSVQSIQDSLGNVYTRAVGPTVRSGFATQGIYYAPNIRAAGANANTVTVTFAAAVPYPDVRIAEYSGIAGVNPVDVVAAAQGSGTSSNSGAATTTNANDLIVGANIVLTQTTGPGASFTKRVITVPDGDILEDRIVTTTGAYSAVAPLTSGAWIMQMVAFKAGAPVVDTQPPAAPANLTATVLSSQVALSWTASTDNVGVTGYRLERCQGDGCSTFGVIVTVTAGTTFTDSGLSASTGYSYRVQAFDSAGNSSGYSPQADVVTGAPDTAPPSAPTNLTATAASGTRIDLAWTPSTDNVAVSGYRVERCQGAGCTLYVKLATVASPSFIDTGLTPNTTYQYVVRAVDGASNLSDYSNETAATTLATIPELVAAYSFDTGAGTTVTDSSDKGNSGTVGAAVWSAAGKYGNALSFNGTGAKVSIPDSSSLRLTTAMTLEAWVNPAAGSGWTDVIYKGNDNYFLEAHSPNGGPAAGATLGNASTFVVATSLLPLNTWTHLAETYDGATLRLYVNGALAGSVARTGSILTSGNPLEIGGDSIYGQYFRGLIDEVRIFNVARTPAQIQTDMNTPLGLSLPVLSLSRIAIDFGSKQTGTTTLPETVAVTNVGGATMTIGSIAVAGFNNGDFAQTNTCGASLAPSATCNITITFTPAAAGTRSAAISISDNAPGSPHTIALSGNGIGFTISPRTAALTPNLTQQFTWTGGSLDVTFAVDGVPSGSATTGTVSATGLYTPPATAGVHVVAVTSADGTQTSSATVSVTTHPGVFTHHNDNYRTGQNIAETVLTPASVTTATFGKIASFALDGYAHASPLYVSSVNIPGKGSRNVVYVATEHNSVYAFDADGVSTSPLWQVSFINPAAGVTTVPASDTGECCDIAPEIGITATPVVDPSTGTLYVVAKTKEVGGGTVYRQRLHALDVATGAEKFGGPIILQASVPGSGAGSQAGVVPFDALHENQRPALLLSNGVVYIEFGSHGDVQPYHGWLLGYNATTLQQVMAFNASPNGAGAGMWQANGGPAADAAGNIYSVTGNGQFDADTGGRDYGTSFLKVSPSGLVLDYFTPHNQASSSSNNFDLGAAGPLLLPDQPGAHPHLMLSAGKDNAIYVVDRDAMGHYNPTNDSQIVQSLVNIFPFGTPEPGNYSSPVYFNGTVYFGPVADTVQAFSLTNGLLSTSPTSSSSVAYSYPGASLSVSANGTANGIVWAIQRNGDCGVQAICGSAAPGVLRAYDATNLGIQLYASDQAGTRDELDFAAKFSVPLVVNGKVFVTTSGRLTIFGLLP